MKKGSMFVLFLFILLNFQVMANTETRVSVVSCEVDLKVGKYDDDTKIILELKNENGNEFTNVYSEKQVRVSEKGYSYIIENSNCVYLDEADYMEVKNNKNAMFWIWLIFLSIPCVLIAVVR